MVLSSTLSYPVRPGEGAGSYPQSTDDRALYLRLFGNEVLNAFNLDTITLNRHTVKTLRGGKSYQFIRTWLSSAETYFPGTEMVGNSALYGDITVTADHPVVAYHSVSDLDELLSQFEIRWPLAQQMAAALAQYVDKNVMRALVITARSDPWAKAAMPVFPRGIWIKDYVLDPRFDPESGRTAGVAPKGAGPVKSPGNPYVTVEPIGAGYLSSEKRRIIGQNWLHYIRMVTQQFLRNGIPSYIKKYLVVTEDIFDIIRETVDFGGRMVFYDTQLRNSSVGSLDVGNDENTFRYHDVTILRSVNLPRSDETTETLQTFKNHAMLRRVYPKYRDDFRDVLGILWCPEAVATVKLQDLTMEYQRIATRKEFFMSASLTTGHGSFRHEAVAVLESNPHTQECQFAGFTVGSPYSTTAFGRGMGDNLIGSTSGEKSRPNPNKPYSSSLGITDILGHLGVGEGLPIGDEISNDWDVVTKKEAGDEKKRRLSEDKSDETHVVPKP